MPNVDELIVSISSQLLDDLDWSGLMEDGDEYKLRLLEIQANALQQLNRYGEEVKVRTIIHETWKRWKGEMNRWTTLPAKENLVKALLKNKEYDTASKWMK